MSTQIVINPKFNHLREYVEHIPDGFLDISEVVQARRNIIKKDSFDGLAINIKRYRKPILINRIVYTFFRKPKAFKAYYNALALIDKGFDTPMPIAYIEEKEQGLLSLSYFISTQLVGVREIREYYYSKAEALDQPFLTAFAKYTARLHNAGILHLDYSPGNILFSEKDDHYSFSLVDINRMEFKDISIEDGCANFCRLFEYDQVAQFIAKEYAKCRKFDASECEQLMLRYKHKFEGKKQRKVKLKKLLGKS